VAATTHGGHKFITSKLDVLHKIYSTCSPSQIRDGRKI